MIKVFDFEPIFMQGCPLTAFGISDIDYEVQEKLHTISTGFSMHILDQVECVQIDY